MASFAASIPFCSVTANAKSLARCRKAPHTRCARRPNVCVKPSCTHDAQLFWFRATSSELADSDNACEVRDKRAMRPPTVEGWPRPRSLEVENSAPRIEEPPSLAPASGPQAGQRHRRRGSTDW